MANNVIAQVLGGQKKVLDNVATVGDVKKQLGVESYSASVDGDAASNDQELEDGAFVTMSPAVKGGR